MSVLADAQIHCNYIINNNNKIKNEYCFCVMGCSHKSFLGENVLV